MQIERIDHIVLTVADIARTCAFYERALGIKTVTFGEGRTALRFGAQKINLHRSGREFEPKAACPTPGSADLCFVTATALDDVLAHLEAQGVAIVEGPAPRASALGAIDSVYLRDPDGNLIEVSRYPDAP